MTRVRSSRRPRSPGQDVADLEGSSSCGSKGGRRGASCRAVDHRQRRQAVRARGRRQPGLELVGCYAWSPDKVGRDVGELCGIDPSGVTATDDVDALLALQPDCVIYNPMWPDVDELVRILEAGVNVVSTAAFINGDGSATTATASSTPASAAALDVRQRHQPRLRRAHRPSSPPASATGSTRSRSTRGRHHAVRLARHRAAGRLRPADRRPRASGMAAGARRCSARRSPWSPMRSASSSTRSSARPSTPRRPRTSAGLVDDPRRHVAGVAASWQGRIGGRTMVELTVRWKKGHARPRLADRGGPRHRVDGLPTVRTKLEYLPPPDFEATTSTTSWCSG